MSKLHNLLKGEYAEGLPEDLFTRLASIKSSAQGWLEGCGKNGIKHSERLEDYLDDLTEQACKDNRILPSEVFILLCASYMHDIGYKYGKDDHPRHSFNMILDGPDKYLQERLCRRNRGG